MDESIRVLLVDEDPGAVALIRRGLQSEFDNVEIEHVVTANAFQQALAQRFDFALTSLRLSWIDGLKTAAQLKSVDPDIQIVLLLTGDDEDMVVKAVKAGFDGYVVKSGNYLSRLSAVIGLAFERRVQRRAAREAELKFQTLFDRVPVGLYRITPDGRILEANTYLALLGGCSDRESLLPLNAIEFFVTRANFDKWRAIVENENGVHDYEGPTRRVDGSIGWVRNSARAVRDEDGNVIYYEGALVDISERKRAEDETRLLQTITLTMSEEMSDLNSALGVVLRKVCEATGWTLGEAWLPNADNSYLEFSGASYTSAPELDEFISRSRDIRFAPGDVLLGKVWSTSKPMWTKDLSLEHDAPRAAVAKAARIKAGMGIPVLAGQTVVAVLGFFAREARAEDQRMMSIVSGVAAQLGLVIQRRRAEVRLQYLSQFDGLTGLPNRTLLVDRLQQTMIEAERHQRLVALMFLDIDRFKNINDSLGHAAGDQLIRSVAERLVDAVRTGDTVARLSGDEFAFVLADIWQLDDVARIARKVLDVFAQPFHVGGQEVYVTASLGISLYPADEKDAQALMRNADIAMYRAKESGRNAYQFYSGDMTSRAAENLVLENELRHAIERSELVLHYQPFVDAKTGRIVGAEALVRWQHGKRGLVPPMQFIPLAEESGLIIPIGTWVLRAACVQCQAWRHLGYRDFRVAVNLSARQFHKGLDSLVIGILNETGLEPSALELELTESVIMQSTDETLLLMQRLADLGVTFSIDDFGTGYSNLSYLKRFPVDILKVDRSFVKDIPDDADDSAIADAIINMGHLLGMQVIAEGVETEQQSQFMRSHGCDTMQGYYFSKPLPANEIEQLLQRVRLLPLSKKSA